MKKIQIEHLTRFSLKTVAAVCGGFALAVVVVTLTLPKFSIFETLAWWAAGIFGSISGITFILVMLSSRGNKNTKQAKPSKLEQAWFAAVMTKANIPSTVETGAMLDPLTTEDWKHLAFAYLKELETLRRLVKWIDAAGMAYDPDLDDKLTLQYFTNIMKAVSTYQLNFDQESKHDHRLYQAFKDLQPLRERYSRRNHLWELEGSLQELRERASVLRTRAYFNLYPSRLQQLCQGCFTWYRRSVKFSFQYNGNTCTIQGTEQECLGELDDPVKQLVVIVDVWIAPSYTMSVLKITNNRVDTYIQGNWEGALEIFLESRGLGLASIEPVLRDSLASRFVREEVQKKQVAVREEMEWIESNFRQSLEPHSTTNEEVKNHHG